MSIKIKYLIVSIIGLLIASATWSQEDNKTAINEQTLTIYTEYSPLLKDAGRMLFLPILSDTITARPKFDYNVFPKVYNTSFIPSPIKIATLKGEPLEPLNIGLLKVGIGNYITPHVELYLNCRRQRDFSIGVAARHHSSSATISNINKQQIYAGFMDNSINLFGKKIFEKLTLSGDLSFNQKLINFYGYDPNILVPDTIVKPRDRVEMEAQSYNRFKTILDLSSNSIASDRFDYGFSFFFQHFKNRDGDKQNKAGFELRLAKFLDKHKFGLNFGLENNNNTLALEEQNELSINANPYYQYFIDGWQLRLGAKVSSYSFADSVETVVHPDIYIQNNISNILIPYFSFKGNQISNSYEYLTSINPFVSNGVISDTSMSNFRNFRITNYAHVVDLGVKVNINKDIFLKLNGNYSKIDNMGLFVNDTSIALQNKFVLEYTNVERFAAYAELDLRNIGDLSVNFKAHYYHYSYIQNQDRPWHLPRFDLRIGTNYKFDENLDFGLNINLVDARYAKVYNFDNTTSVWSFSEKKLPITVDVSLYGNYMLTKDFHVFLNLNNMLGQRQYVWNNYMSQRFNFLAGIKYLF